MGGHHFFGEKEKKTELSIYTCGNNKEIIMFNKKEVGGDNFMETNEECFKVKHTKFDWCFNYYLTEMNDKLINEIMKKICEGYRNKKGTHNNIILIFFDSQEKMDEKQKKIQLIFEKLNQTNKIYNPIIILAFKNHKNKEEENYKENGENFMDNENEGNFETTNKEENLEENEQKLIDDVIKVNKYNNYSIKKYLEIVHYNENNYSEIRRKINSIYNYFNNIGDMISILDEMIRGYNFCNSKMRNKRKFAATFNILVLGRPGSGKSTLINLLLNKRKAREGIGESITKVVSKYVHDKYPLTLEDTPGFEDDNDLKKMIQFLEDSNKIFKGGKNDFHLVLYLINSSNERTFMGEEVALINYIEKNMKIPIFFVCTRSKNKEHAKDFEETVKMNLWQNFGETNLVDHIYCCHLLNEKDGIYKRFGVDELLEGIKNYFNEEIVKKENELFGNETNESIEDNSIFLPGLKDHKEFENYLNDISLKIIEDYVYFVYEELKKTKNNEQNNNNIDKINELLVDHLSLELNGKYNGNIFCKNNRAKVFNNIQSEIEYSTSCSSIKTKEEQVKGIKIYDEQKKEYIRTTREFGMEALKQFLNEIRLEDGFEEYLKTIIENYKSAIQSLPNLNKINE